MRILFFFRRGKFNAQKVHVTKNEHKFCMDVELSSLIERELKAFRFQKYELRNYTHTCGDRVAKSDNHN